MWLCLCHGSVSQCAIGACHSSVPQGMGMWQTLGLGHLGQLVHFLSSIIHHDGGFGEHGHLPPSIHTPYLQSMPSRQSIKFITWLLSSVILLDWLTNMRHAGYLRLSMKVQCQAMLWWLRCSPGPLHLSLPDKHYYSKHSLSRTQCEKVYDQSLS